MYCGDQVRHLHVPRRLHGLDDDPVLHEEGRAVLGERGLADPGRPGDQNARSTAGEPLCEPVRTGVVVKRDVDDRPDGCDLHAVDERTPRDRDPHRADLEDRYPAALVLDEAVVVSLGPFEAFLSEGIQLVLARGLVANLHKACVADRAPFRVRRHELLQVDCERLLVKELVDAEGAEFADLRAEVLHLEALGPGHLTLDPVAGHEECVVLVSGRADHGVDLSAGR